MIESKICPACKIEKKASEFYKSKQRKDGLRCQCKECERKKNAEREPLYRETRKKYRQSNRCKELKRQQYKNNKDKVIENNKKQSKKTLGGRLFSYKRSATARNIDQNLTDEEFKSFWQVSCSYCGSEIKTIVLDRIDSDKGYQLDNVISCCSICNKMKMDLSYDKFINQINKIYNCINENNKR